MLKNLTLNCKEFIQKIIEKTGGKGGGIQNFAQVIHNIANFDYKNIIQTLNIQ